MKYPPLYTKEQQVYTSRLRGAKRNYAVAVEKILRETPPRHRQIVQHSAIDVAYDVVRTVFKKSK
jgi:hypothetical protein